MAGREGLRPATPFVPCTECWMTRCGLLQGLVRREQCRTPRHGLLLGLFWLSFSVMHVKQCTSVLAGTGNGTK